jgi:hypothetical protein
MINTHPARPRTAILARMLLGCALTLGAGLAQAIPKPDLWAFWFAQDAASTETVSHDDWATLLSRYVSTLPGGRTVVDYQALSANDAPLLDRYISGLTARDPRALNRDEQMAYWINLYNALTLKVVLDHPKKKSILRMGGGWLPTGPWDDEVARIASQDITLNDIEHRILRPIWQDHRIHFAVNCASVGCPNLATEPFLAGTLNQQLDAAEVAFLTHPRGLTFRGDKLRLSSIFDWYMEDFAKDRDGLLSYLAGVGGVADPERVRSYSGSVKYRYDWDLNAKP